MTRAELIANLRALVNVADHYRSAFYLTPPATAGGRRYEEHLGTVPFFEWEEGGHKFTACYRVQCTCRYIHANGYYTRDGKKTNLTAIKNSLKRLEAEHEQEDKENV